MYMALPFASILLLVSNSTIFAVVILLATTRITCPVSNVFAVTSITAPPSWKLSPPVSSMSFAPVSICKTRPAVKELPVLLSFNNSPVVISWALISTIVPASSESPCTCNKRPFVSKSSPSPDVICNALPVVRPFVLIFIAVPVFIASAVNRTRPSGGPDSVAVLKSSNDPLVSEVDDSTVIADPVVNFDAFMYNIVPFFCFSPRKDNNVPLTYFDIVQSVSSIPVAIAMSLPNVSLKTSTNVIVSFVICDILKSPLFLILSTWLQLPIVTLSPTA